jgi:acyl-lipid omega-6 desaturase (Delta-12 desaturase)
MDVAQAAQALPEASAQRTEKDLILATRPFTDESTARSWAYTVSTLALLVALTAGAALAPTWWLRLAFSVVEGLTIVRTFILFHDYYHGAILRGSKLADALYTVFGLTILSPPSVWKETHNYHHAHTAKMVGSHIGSYPVLTTGMYQELSPAQQTLYRLARNPLNMVLAILTVFLLGMNLRPFVRAPLKHWGGLVSPLLVAGFTWALWSTGHGDVWLYAWFIPCWLGMMAGAYLFYAQHNYPEAYIADRASWTYSGAALRSSSYFKMGKVMHWFTGNIGFHHVHHLNAAIPFYRLEETMKGVPELQHPGTTSWAPRDIAANFKLKLWDPEKGTMVGYPS